MVATPLQLTNRFIAPEISKFYWITGVDGIADVTAPTRIELDGGLDLSGEVAESSGWEVTGQTVDVPDGGTRITGKIPGRVTLGDAQLVFYASQDTNDIRQVLIRGDRGFMVVLHGGDVEGQTCDVFPSQVNSVSKPVDYAGTAAQMVTVTFALSVPGEDVEIPAA
jgi:hypothetical protein